MVSVRVVVTMTFRPGDNGKTYIVEADLALTTAGLIAVAAVGQHDVDWRSVVLDNEAVREESSSVMLFGQQRRWAFLLLCLYDLLDSGVALVLERTLPAPRDFCGGDDKVVSRWALRVWADEGGRSQEANLTPVRVDDEATLGLVHCRMRDNVFEHVFHRRCKGHEIGIHGDGQHVPQRHSLH